MIRLLRAISRRLWLREIHGESGPYLERYWIFGWMPEFLWARAPLMGHRAIRPRPDRFSRFGLYLHRFVTPDQDQESPHSHPWKWAVSLVLAGGYTEQRLVTCSWGTELVTRRIRPGTLNFLRHDTYHVVTELHGAETWTLILTGPKTRSWGFWVHGRGHVPWRERLAERGIQA
jgi:hypothetical protein